LVRLASRKGSRGKISVSPSLSLSRVRKALKTIVRRARLRVLAQ
jgi:hypothetical protein